MRYCLVAKCDKRFPVAMRFGETPVPIPNTTVKTKTAESTILVTVWEDRWLPDHKKALTAIRDQREIWFLMTAKAVRVDCTLKTEY